MERNKHRQIEKTKPAKLCNWDNKYIPKPFSAEKYYYYYIALYYIILYERLCGLVVRVPGYRSRSPGFDSRRNQIFCEVVDVERGPLNLVRINEELLEWKSSCSGSRKSILTAVGIRCADTQHPVSAKVGTNFADMRRSLGRYSSLVGQSHGV
jgi:hypothetical protein